MAETGIELVRLGHLNLDGTPGSDDDPDQAVVFGQVDVTVTDNCRVSPKTLAA